MASRTNSLHDKLEPDLRKQIERDLVERPPGRAAYVEVYEHYGLQEKGISFTAMARYGAYLRKLAEDQWIRQLADATVNVDGLDDDIRGTLRVRMFEALHSEDLKIGELLKLAMAENAVTKSTVTVEQWEAKKRKTEQALERAEAAARQDPEKALADAIADIRGIYNLGAKGE